MFIERRKTKTGVKHYLIHSYREKGEVRKIRRYLGFNLNEKELELARGKFEKEIKQKIDAFSTEVFNFSLTNSQVESLNNIDIDIKHFKYWSDFKEEFAYNTNAIEGSSLELDEVKEISHGKKPEVNDELEAKGVLKAIEYVKKTKEKFGLDLLLKLHKMCFIDTKSFAGKFRDVEVVIRNNFGDVIHKGVSVSKLKDALNELVDFYDKNNKKFKPLVLAAIIHNQFEYIHPFADGNGRVGRLLLNYVLLKKNYPPINIYFSDRMKYYHTLQEYSRNNNLKPTLRFLIKQYKKR